MSNVVAPATNPLMGALDELSWLKANPDFRERPATLEEFLGQNYLNIEHLIRKRVKQELIHIMGDVVNGKRPTRYKYALITGGIGIGKTTIASIVLPYLAHWLLCLKDPQAFFHLLPGTRIALMQMSTSEQQAREVIFQDIKARISNSPWFRNWPTDSKYTNQIRFGLDIWIIPGDSAETTFEGYNIFGGILDEADSHKVTPQRDYANQGFTTIEERVDSRFEDSGFLMVIGQRKSANGFAETKYQEFKRRPDAYAVSLAIWESYGSDHYEKDANGVVKTFTFDIRRRQVVPAGVREVMGSSPNLIDVPIRFLNDFKTHPENALRDKAGIPPLVGSTFISLYQKIEEARDRWNKRYPGVGSPVLPDGRLASWFHAPNTLKRVVHLDIAYAQNGDSFGIAMGHVPEVTEREDEMKPIVVFDLLMRVQAPPSGEIFIADARKWIYYLKSKLKFNIDVVSMDGFESTETRQQLTRKRYNAVELSIDRQIGPYHDLREAIYEDRVEFPPYIAEIRRSDGTHEQVEIAIKELSELVDNGKKIDHPLNGSKDVTDCMAGVTFTLMGDRRYRRNVTSIDIGRMRREARQQETSGFSHPAYNGALSLKAPLPPTGWSNNEFSGP